MRHHNDNRTKVSVIVLQTVFVALCFIVLGRVFYLQIIDYDTYAEIGSRNSIRQEYVEPARGLIYDRNGQLIVDNKPTYSVTIIPGNFDKSKIPLMAEILGVSDSLLNAKVIEAQSYSWYRSSKIFNDIDFKTFTAIEENIWQLPGVGHQIEGKRNYPTEMRASHILGYLREASREDYLNNDDIRLGDQIGKSGLELVYENSLKGELGIDFIRVNAFGQSLGVYSEEEGKKPPIQGHGLVTTLDLELQILAEKLLKGKKGSVVALDPNTGEILAMASAPDYDLSELSGRINREYWQFINFDESAPLYNRAVSGRQPPGSTLKPLMGIIGMDLGIVTPNTRIYNSGQYMRGRAYRDLADPGYYNLEKAITFSSNTYFLSVMDDIATSGNFNKWSQKMNDFGLGVPNNIDLPSSSKGIVPDSTYLNERFGIRKWSLGDVLNLGIGQGLIVASPLQIAQMTASIANGGYRIRPHLVKAIEQPNGKIEELPVFHEKIDWVKESYIETVKKGMRRVVTEGSGRYYADVPDAYVAGKTGTAQNPFGEDHGWFISFAPVDNPKIAVAVLLENSGFGSISAAPVASLIIEQYLFGEVKRKHVLDYVLDFKPKLSNAAVGNE